jgi:hypothetical protein
LPIPMGWREPRLGLSRFRNTTAESAERPNSAFSVFTWCGLKGRRGLQR